MKKTLLLLSAVVALSSCNKTWFEATNHKEYPAISKDDVIVYQDGRAVPKGAEELGIINWKSTNERKAVRRVRREAARHGANAVYYIPYKGKDLSRCNHGKFYAVIDKK